MGNETDIHVPPSPPKTPLIDNKKIFLWYHGHGQREQERLQQEHFGSWINGNQFINLKNFKFSPESRVMKAKIQLVRNW